MSSDEALLTLLRVPWSLWWKIGFFVGLGYLCVRITGIAAGDLLKALGRKLKK